MHPNLIVFDFDRTIAETFVPSPNGIDVNVASRRAIGRLFGKEGIILYDQMGGLKGREPGELIGAMVQVLDSVTDKKKKTQDYVDEKLDMLIPEISPWWPKLLPGVDDFFHYVDNGTIPIDVAVVSSGHDDFIRRVFEVNDLTPPANLVTSDWIRLHSMPPNRPRYKPHTFQLAQAHRNWDTGWIREHHFGEDTLLYQHEINGLHVDRLLHGKKRMAYVGDDFVKDGGLAFNARIPFLFIPQERTTHVAEPLEGQRQLKDFDELSDILCAWSYELANGTDFTSVFFGVRDSEIFPPLAESERPFNRWLEAQRNGAHKERF